MKKLNSTFVMVLAVSLVIQAVIFQRYSVFSTNLLLPVVIFIAFMGSYSSVKIPIAGMLTGWLLAVISNESVLTLSVVGLLFGLLARRLVSSPFWHLEWVRALVALLAFVGIGIASSGVRLNVDILKLVGLFVVVNTGLFILIDMMVARRTDESQSV